MRSTHFPQCLSATTESTHAASSFLSSTPGQGLRVWGGSLAAAVWSLGRYWHGSWEGVLELLGKFSPRGEGHEGLEQRCGGPVGGGGRVSRPRDRGTARQEGLLQREMALGLQTPGCQMCFW